METPMTKLDWQLTGIIAAAWAIACVLLTLHDNGVF